MKMNDVLGNDSALARMCYAGPETTWANEMICALNLSPGAGLIARAVDQQSSCKNVK